MKINCWSNQQNPTPLWKFMMKYILRHTTPKRTTLYHIWPWALLKKPCLDSLCQQSRYRTVSALCWTNLIRVSLCYIEKQMHYEWQMYSKKKREHSVVYILHNSAAECMFGENIATSNGSDSVSHYELWHRNMQHATSSLNIEQLWLSIIQSRWQLCFATYKQ